MLWKPFVTLKSLLINKKRPNYFPWGDGDCPHCGGELEFVETEGHELKDGDYYTPNSYIVDNYVYRCVECGEIIKTPNEL